MTVEQLQAELAAALAEIASLRTRLDAVVAELDRTQRNLRIEQGAPE